MLNMTITLRKIIVNKKYQLEISPKFHGCIDSKRPAKTFASSLKVLAIDIISML
jgi:hypothetical protein